MRRDIAYSLEIVGSGIREDYYFEDKKEAFDSYSAIVNAFEGKLITEVPPSENADKVIGLSIMKTYFGGVPKGEMADFSPQSLFKSTVYEDVNKMARELHRTSESGIYK
ncbi:hypothetical protein [Sporosarcina sp. P17b]|uniref:hypothetical protein n=1 Tax=Sporosarcina sp. P17b TaxID=2048260 RepID=UPI00117A05F8|nr:hypothetical protein [Sporosarcina sp. P17b]